MRSLFLLSLPILLATACSQNPHVDDTPTGAAVSANAQETTEPDSHVVDTSDRDHDGVLDADDKCPDEPGPAENDGCPYEKQHESHPKQEERKVLLEVKKSLKFDFDRSTLQDVSFPALNKLARFLKKYPDAHIRMVGYADDRGTYVYNDVLSDARVLTVKYYLVDRGVDERRISTGYRGEHDPLVNPEGKRGEALDEARRLNRRVDMTVRYAKMEPVEQSEPAEQPPAQDEQAE